MISGLIRAAEKGASDLFYRHQYIFTLKRMEMTEK